MKMEEEEEKNRPLYFAEAEIKGLIEEYIEKISEGKQKEKEKKKE